MAAMGYARTSMGYARICVGLINHTLLLVWDYYTMRFYGLKVVCN